MSRFRLPALVAALACAATIGAPAAAQARVHVKISRVDIRTERAHPAVPTLRAVLSVCVRNTTTAHRRVTATVRSNFLLSPRHGSRGSWGYTIPIELNAERTRETCEQRNVAGVVEDVQRRLRITTERSDGVGWEGRHEVAIGHRAS